MGQQNPADKRKLKGTLLRPLIWGYVEGGQRTYREHLGIGSIRRQWGIERGGKRERCWTATPLNQYGIPGFLSLRNGNRQTRKKKKKRKNLENSALGPYNVKYGKIIQLSNYYNQNNQKIKTKWLMLITFQKLSRKQLLVVN